MSTPSAGYASRLAATAHNPEAVFLAAVVVRLDRARGVNHRIRGRREIGVVFRSDRRLHRRAQDRPSLTFVKEIGTFEMSACICIQSSLLVGPPETITNLGSKSCARIVRKMFSVP